MSWGRRTPEEREEDLRMVTEIFPLAFFVIVCVLGLVAWLLGW